ncbi:Serine/threonine-protein kinase B [Acaryochloris thomasi RCC1774]|uniref:non-specific serine/threonine protein kinase n=1 Tax=Acaryochloris thomasi RCC1774 TaxID=1764569 RepID=A0A2W1J800_9CYAN|nr:serine/threonine-protein kinase [Acaryochloris thomasi]PZD70559.1 Serine/threonine-protein kinase B [Acaryochloris thomasi RCC1774]
MTNPATCFCVNPSCERRENFFEAEHCQSCGSPLKINSRYKLIASLTELSVPRPTEVFEAQCDSGEIKVVKTLFRDDEPYFSMFEREVSALRSFSHPAIPKLLVSDQFIVNLPGKYKVYGFAMEKIPGETLQKQLDSKRPIPSALGLDYLKQLSTVLHYIHQHKLFHRDIKPSNIILKEDGQLALIDFGGVRSSISHTYLAKVASGDVTRLSSSGYTPPEQESGSAIPQSDIFALGRTVIYLLTGREPFELPIDEKTGQLLWREHAKKLDPRLANLLDRMTALAPGDRPTNTNEVLESTERLLHRPNIEPKLKIKIWMIPVALAIAMASFGLYRAGRRVVAAWHSANAQILEERGELTKARDALENSIKLVHAPDTIEELAEVCTELKDYDCSIKAYRESIRLDPTWERWFELGVFYDLREERKDAALAYASAIALAPNESTEAYNNLSRIEILEGKAKKATELTRIALTHSNSSETESNLQKNLGWALLQQGSLDLSEKALSKSIALNSNNTAAHCLLTQILNTKGKDSSDNGSQCLTLNYDQPEVKKWREDYLRSIR